MGDKFTVVKGYKQLRFISGEALLDNSPCEYGFDDFVIRFGFYPEVNLKDFLQFASRYWVNFLIEHGYIERVEEKADEKVYHIGQKFLGSDNALYILASMTTTGKGYRFCDLINTHTGYCWGRGFVVNDVLNITEAEFTQIRGTQHFYPVK